VLLADLEFPSIDNLVKWPNAFTDGFPYFNKIALIDLLALLGVMIFFLVANKRQAVPTGSQNLAESAVSFIDEGIVQQTIGHGGEKYIPYLISIFFFVLFTNIFEIIPVFAMPANARMGNPAFIALLTWAFFICAGVKAQGLGYFKSALFPPGVPKALYLLVTPIEFISTFIVRPFSLAVRLFANMLAGHILLVTFGVLTLALLTGGVLIVMSWLPFLVLIGLTGFEVLVSFLQAYVFTILAAVYIGGAVHPEH
jgi:F-type H+-transporting ATPase subunit a